MRNQQHHHRREQQRALERRACGAQFSAFGAQPFADTARAPGERPDFAQQGHQHQPADPCGAQRQNHLQLGRDREEEARALKQHLLMLEIDHPPQPEHREVGMKCVVAGGVADGRQRGQRAAKPGNRLLEPLKQFHAASLGIFTTIRQSCGRGPPGTGSAGCLRLAQAG